MLSYQLIISGDVQGVGFRAGAFRAAARLLVRGYAKNNPYGTVEILIQGPKQNVDQFIDWARIGLRQRGFWQ